MGNAEWKEGGKENGEPIRFLLDYILCLFPFVHSFSFILSYILSSLSEKHSIVKKVMAFFGFLVTL